MICSLVIGFFGKSCDNDIRRRGFRIDLGFMNM